MLRHASNLAYIMQPEPFFWRSADSIQGYWEIPHTHTHNPTPPSFPLFFLEQMRDRMWVLKTWVDYISLFLFSNLINFC